MIEIALLASENYRKETIEFLEKAGIKQCVTGLSGLRKILSAFSMLPYENVSKIICNQEKAARGSVLLRLPDEVWSGFQASGLGGTCFSLTWFLHTILENCEFGCYLVTADMRWGQNVHCGLVVILDEGEYFCDPGYLLGEPLPLLGIRYKYLRSASRGVILDYQKGRYHLATLAGKELKWRYSFRAQPCSPAEFVNYWLASFEQAGMHKICLSRQQPEGMVYVHNRYYREIRGGRVIKKKLSANWLRELEELFHIPRQLLGKAADICRSWKNEA